jgi:hypothetical protein
MVFSKLVELIFPARRTPVDCEACGQTFVCGASLLGCWCREIKLDSNKRQQLRGKYKHCLCRECLTRFETQPHL